MLRQTAGSAAHVKLLSSAGLLTFSLPAGLAGQAWPWHLLASPTANPTPSPSKRLTVVHSPHNTKSWSTNFIKGLPASDHLPENDPPAEHITLLAVIAA